MQYDIVSGKQGKKSVSLLLSLHTKYEINMSSYEKRIVCVNKEMSTRGNGVGSPTLLRSDIGFMRTIYQHGYYIYGASLLSTRGCPRARVGMIPNNMSLRVPL